MISPRHPLFSVILLTYLISGLLYATLTPRWQAPDEPAHYNYIRYLATQAAFPELTRDCYDQTYLNILTTRHFPPQLSIDKICYEFHQPPLYYLLAVPFFKLGHGSPLLLRLFSVSLGAGVVMFAFFIARTIFPHQAALVYGTMAFVAFVPMHGAMLASINNDALAELILAALLFLLCPQLRQNNRSATALDIATAKAVALQHAQFFGKTELFLAILLGLGLLTKLTIYIILPLVGVSYLRLKNLRGLSLIYGLAFLMALPWYIRNAALYGRFDILGLGRHGEVVVGQLRPAERIAQVGWWAYLSDFVTTTFHSFWGQFGWMAVPMDSRVYLALTLLTLMAVVGLMLNVRQTKVCPALTLQALLILGAGSAYVWYNWQFVQFQGRYLFSAMVPIGLFFSLGLREILSYSRRWWLLGGLTLALLWVIGNAINTSNLDKWALVVVGLPLSIAIGRARYESISAEALMAACYVALGGLTMVAPFWFIVPYL